MRFSKEIDKEEAKKYFVGEEHYSNLICPVIDKTTVRYIATLDKIEELDNMQIFAWKDWPLFEKLNKSRELRSFSKLCSLDVATMAKKLKEKPELLAGHHVNKFKQLGNLIYTNGYQNIRKMLLIYAKGKDVFYNADGLDRAVIYRQYLTDKSKEFTSIDCIICEVESIDRAMQDQSGGIFQS